MPNLQQEDERLRRLRERLKQRGATETDKPPDDRLDRLRANLGKRTLAARTDVAEPPSGASPERPSLLSRIGATLVGPDTARRPGSLLHPPGEMDAVGLRPPTAVDGPRRPRTTPGEMDAAGLRAPGDRLIAPHLNDPHEPPATPRPTAESKILAPQEAVARAEERAEAAVASHTNRFKQAAQEVGEFLASAGKGLAHGVGVGAELGGVAMQSLGETTGLESVERAGEAVEKKGAATRKRFAIPDESDLADRIIHMATQGLGTSLPILAFGMLAGKASPAAIAPAAAWLATGAIGYGYGVGDVRRTLEEAGAPVEKARRIAYLAGIPYAALERLGEFRILKNLGAGKLAERGLKAFVKRLLREGLITSGIESRTEGLQSLLTSTVRGAATDQEFGVADIKQAGKEAFAAGLSGLLMGSGASVVQPRQATEASAAEPQAPPAPPGPPAAPTQATEAPGAPTPEKPGIVAKLRRRVAEVADPTVRTELQEAYTDPLSGLANANAFKQARARIDEDPAMEWVSVDVIGLKNTNDYVSPAAGDALIARIGDAVRQVADLMDVPQRNAMRPHGDEFGIAVPAGQGETFGRLLKELVGEQPIGETGLVTGIRYGVAPTWDEAAKAAQDKKALETDEKYKRGAKPIVAEAVAGVPAPAAEQAAPTPQPEEVSRSKAGEPPVAAEAPAEVAPAHEAVAQPPAPPAAPVTVAPASERKAPQPAAPESPKLPTSLAGAKPRYGYRDRQFTLRFESDLDRALYIVAQKTPSKRDAEYMNWLRKQMPGAVTQDIRAAGEAVRARIKALAVAAKGDEIVVPAINRPSAAAPAAEQAAQQAIFGVAPPAAEAAPEAAAPPAFGTTNTIVTADRAAELKAKLAKKLNQLNVGLDPEQVAAGAELTVYYIEGGVRKFVDVAHRLATDLGVKVGKLKPYLKQWYNDARARLAKAGQDVADLDTPAQVDAAYEGLEAEPAPRIVSLRKAEGAALRQELGLPALAPPDAFTDQAAWDEALRQNLAAQAIDIARAWAEQGRPLNKVEQAAAVQRRMQLARELDEARALLMEASQAGNEPVITIAWQRTNRIIEEHDLVTRALDTTGTAAGRALQGRKLAGNIDTDTLAAAIQLGITLKGAPYTPDEINALEKLTDEVARLKKEVAELAAKDERLEEERQKQIAEAVAKAEAAKARSGRKDKSHLAKLKSEREDILKQLTALGVRLNDLTGVSAEGIRLIGRLAVNHIRIAHAEQAGEVELDDIIKKVLADLNNPAITERDVREALAGRSPKQIRKAKTDADRMVQDLKAQARLLGKIEDAEKGIFDPKRSRGQQSAAVLALKARLTELRTAAYRTVKTGEQLERVLKTINELQDQLANHYRTLKKPRAKPETTAELEALKEKVRALRQEMRTEDALADVLEQLRTGEFKITAKPRPKPVSPEHERKQIALRKARRAVRQALEAKRPHDLMYYVRGGVDFLRTMKATADMSATLRQAIVPSIRRPGMAVGAQGKAIQAFFAEYTEEQIHNAMLAHPYQLLRDRAGLELSDVGGLLNDREEFFRSHLAKRIPVVGIVVRASDRHMTTMLNLVRVGSFDWFVDKFPNATDTELKAWANWVNVSTGKGALGRARAALNILSLGLFAPRFAVSRIETPGMVFYYWKQPRVRNEIAKDMAAFLGAGILTLALAALAGFKVGEDLRESDFGKIVLDEKTYIDIWAGIQQPMRLLAQAVVGLTDRYGLTGEGLTDADKEFDPVEEFGRFVGFKLSPPIMLGRELYTGKTAVGTKVKPITLPMGGLTLPPPTRTALSAFMPILMGDVHDAYTLSGPGAAAVTGVGGFFGLSISTYEKSESRTRRDIRKLISEGRQEEGRAMMRAWNAEHPDKPIRAVGDLTLPAEPRERRQWAPRERRPQREREPR